MSCLQLSPHTLLLTANVVRATHRVGILLGEGSAFYDRFAQTEVVVSWPPFGRRAQAQPQPQPQPAAAG